MKRQQKLVMPSKLLTSDTSFGVVNSWIAVTLAGSGAMPCSEKTYPWKMRLLYLKMHFSLFKVSPRSLILSSAASKFASWSASSPPKIRMSSLISMTPFKPLRASRIAFWKISAAQLTPKWGYGEKLERSWLHYRRFQLSTYKETLVKDGENMCQDLRTYCWPWTLRTRFERKQCYCTT